ncbi:uncharacterized protein RCC_10401 [Ramularia collo-cygni]|uniref:FAD dependent oxidoreductase domain-containing protein n=1 Tax=Ramularia collo-cygni TaxID=112498 RepID=A0A2D3VNW7_9PEZI|nr:uncharacterized protein RCC_10401 [Ramularia collo-cygni]CZT24674.1 uncharacterized protein RCC_10401 [Ramularia collo-cygni]
MIPKQNNKVPPEIVQQLIKDALQDPQLPRQNPTEAFWQLPAAEHAKAQSAKLSSVTTYAIIGSGITGCSVAKNLLDNLPADSNSTVTVFEARSLTSGATGRNGGHILSPVPEEFGAMSKGFGATEAAKIGRFANRTLESMHGLAATEGLTEAAQVRHVRTITGFRDEKLLDEAKKSFLKYEECVQEAQGDGQVLTSEEATQEYNLKDTVGAISCSAGAFWPYRLVTGIFARMLSQYDGRFFLETETPVTAVAYQPEEDRDHPYSIDTARGTVHATKVIYCSNGWTGHLIPNLRGKIFPLRGTMSVQKAGSELPSQGDQRSWSMIDKPQYNNQDSTFSYGLYYITQDPMTGDVFIGGEKQRIGEVLSSDDTTTSSVSQKTLENILPTIFAKGWRDGEVPEVKKLWSGVMGFTPDHLPWVGQIPKDVTGRAGDGEFIAAGFNGYGMPLCWGCGEAVAKMILGKEAEVSEWLPASFLVSSKRLNSVFTTPEAAVAGLLGQLPDWLTTAKLVGRHAVNLVRGALFRWM